jgi:ATP-dependent RNA helicase DDX19/DBP5
MSDTKKDTGSLADRITQPTPALNGSSAALSPSAEPVDTKTHTSWADEVASPTAGDDKTGQIGGQLDGVSREQNGSGFTDAQYEVQVKLSDIQGQTDSPLYSINTFEDLGM